jgi:hypothetical protein
MTTPSVITPKQLATRNEPPLPQPPPSPEHDRKAFIAALHEASKGYQLFYGVAKPAAERQRLRALPPPSASGTPDDAPEATLFQALDTDHRAWIRYQRSRKRTLPATIQSAGMRVLPARPPNTAATTTTTTTTGRPRAR